MLSREKIYKNLKNWLKKPRLAHCLRVEKTAIQLAKIHGADEKKVSLAALLHDVAKEMPAKLLLQLAKKHKLKIEPAEKYQPKLLHGPISAVIAKEKFKIKNKDILKAIAHHTTGTENMSKLEKIIYLADHIEPARRYKGAQAVRKLSRKNMEKAVVKCASLMLEYLNKKKHPTCIKTILTRDYYLNK